MIVKELVDKALDACEEAGIAPPRHLAGGKILVPELAFAATPHVVYDGVSLLPHPVSGVMAKAKSAQAKEITDSYPSHRAMPRLSSLGPSCLNWGSI